MGLTPRARRESDSSRAEQRQRAERYLTEHGFTLGDRIKVDGEGTAVFTIVDAGRDGSITCTARDGSGFRSFRPDWCYPATRVNRRGHTVPNTIPPQVRGRRRAWRAEHGFRSPENTSGETSPSAPHTSAS